MIVHIEEILGIYARLGQINSTPLNEIEFYKNDKKVEIASDVIEEFKFTGLNNTDFVRMDFPDVNEIHGEEIDNVG